MTHTNLHMPLQAAPVNRIGPSAAAATGNGVEANLWGLPIGDVLEGAGGVIWPYAKEWLNA